MDSGDEIHVVDPVWPVCSWHLLQCAGYSAERRAESAYVCNSHLPFLSTVSGCQPKYRALTGGKPTRLVQLTIFTRQRFILHNQIQIVWNKHSEKILSICVYVYMLSGTLERELKNKYHIHSQHFLTKILQNKVFYSNEKHKTPRLVPF